MGKVAEILKVYKNNLSSFVKLFNYLKKNNIRWKDIKYAIDNKNRINFINQQKENLENEIRLMISKKEYLLENLINIKTAKYQNDDKL